MTEPVERKLAAILSADAVGYSRLMAEDESATIRTLTDYREQIAVLVRQHRGRVVDAPGDNLLAEFPSALDAVQGAVEIQRVIQARNADLRTERRMEFRIGVHLGDVAVEGERIYGDGVNIAARLEGLAEAGGICISGTVHEQVRRKLELAYEDLGEQKVKNIPEPVRVYRIRVEGEPLSPRVAVKPRRRTALAATLVLLVGVGAVALWGVYLLTVPPAEKPVPRDTAARELPNRPSIAVLPFVNMSGDPEQEHFSDGLTEEIITKLSRLRELFVIGRSSTFQYKGQAIDPRKVGRELGTHYILEGSVRRATDTVRVTAQLLDASKGTHVWAQTYERDLTAANLFAVQDEITSQVVAAIDPAYGAIARARLKEIRGKSTEGLDAYDCVVRAHAYYSTNLTPGEHARVRDCLERALELDPGFAPAWKLLTDIYLDEHRCRYNPRPGSLDRALKAAQRAVELDPASGRAHEILGAVYFFRRQMDLFLIEVDRALALAPDDSDTLADVGQYLAFAGQWERGVALAKKAIALTSAPQGWYYLPLAHDHYRRGEYEEVLAAAQKMDMPEFFWTPALLAMAYGQLGREQEARASIERLQRLKPDFTLETARDYVGAQVVEEEAVEHELDGLRKAGLT